MEEWLTSEMVPSNKKYKMVSRGVGHEREDDDGGAADVQRRLGRLLISLYSCTQYFQMSVLQG